MNNISGIKKTIIDQINNLKGQVIEKDCIISLNVLEQICSVTEKLGREIAIYIDRRGMIVDAAIGENDRVLLNSISNKRSESSLSGIRCIHTHPNGEAMLSEADLSAIKKLKFDLIVSIGVNKGLPCSAYIGYLGLTENDDICVNTVGPFNYEKLKNLNFKVIIDDIEAGLKKIRYIPEDTEDIKERAILVGIEKQEDLDELEELLKTAGGVALGRLVQIRDKIDNACFIGKGKLKELSIIVQNLDANLVVFDEELSGAQVRNLEEALGTRVIDRTQLILDIFAKRAKSKTGKLQVELAQLKYFLPRLVGMGSNMSRTGGGIGSKGPGEKKLELDRRKIRDRINDLEKEIKEMKKHRKIQRENRLDKGIFQICLVGYTNAGKSTLLNTLAGADVYAENQLFATLDPTTRRVELASGKEFLITDTVGFIKKLPHTLIEAFKSTLEEVVFADLLLHVVDGSNPEADLQKATVLEVLKELEASQKPIITVINKIDQIKENIEMLNLNKNDKSDIVYISAKHKTGIDTLLNMIEDKISANFKKVNFIIPYNNVSLVSFLHDNSKIIDEQYKEDGIYIKAEVDSLIEGKLSQYKIN